MKKHVRSSEHSAQLVHCEGHVVGRYSSQRAHVKVDREAKGKPFDGAWEESERVASGGNLTTASRSVVKLGLLANEVWCKLWLQGVERRLTPVRVSFCEALSLIYLQPDSHCSGHL